jgi:ABC-type oligopeptide transport system ATPase subunit
MSLANKYIQYGVPSNWAHNYDLVGLSITVFKQTTKKNLESKYSIPKVQIDFVKKCLVRQPIDEPISQKLLENNNFLCCLCKGQKSDAYIIHHIVDYSISQDNSYSNLAVLCPNDHDLAHRKGVALTNKISEKEIREAKKSWEKQVRLENKNRAVKRKIHDWKNVNPYKELQAYTEADQEFFFGREEEIKAVEARINKYGVVGLFGESGTGKTSLVNAGIVPIFKTNGFIIVSVRCLDEPIKRVREELLKTLKEKRISIQSIEELAASDTFPRSIIQLRSIVDKENINLIIIIDQFEELFTRALEAEKKDLAKGITESLAVSPIKGKIYFLLSLREDYIGELWDWSHLYDLENAWIHQYRIKRLNKEKAFEVIVQPLYRLNIKVDDKFVLHLIRRAKENWRWLNIPPVFTNRLHRVIRRI